MLRFDVSISQHQVDQLVLHIARQQLEQLHRLPCLPLLHTSHATSFSYHSRLGSNTHPPMPSVLHVSPHPTCTTNTYKVLPKHSQSPQPTPPRKHKTHTQPQQPHPQVSSFYRCSQHESRGLARVVRHRASTPTPLPSQHIMTPFAPPVQALTRIALQAIPSDASIR